VAGLILVAGLFSLIGMAAFAYGKHTTRFGPLIGGIVLMVFPYFVHSLLVMVLVGTAILAGMFLFPD
jgi:hypothetical protein